MATEHSALTNPSTDPLEYAAQIADLARQLAKPASVYPSKLLSITPIGHPKYTHALMLAGHVMFVSHLAECANLAQNADDAISEAE